MKIPRIMLAAASSGSGKTMVTCGLLKLLQRRGTAVSAFKCGPDYIDPMFHKQALQTPSVNLDGFFTEPEMLRYLFARHAAGSELAVLEGVMGYYDGLAGISTTASASDVAAITETPALLIVNARGMSVSVLALIQGFLSFLPQSRIGGVILNQISAGMYRELVPQIEALGIKACGYLPRIPDLAVESRYLGLVLPREVAELDQKLTRLAEVMEETLDVAAILELAQAAPELTAEPPLRLKQLLRSAQVQQLQQHKPVLAVARDQAFCFIYEDNLRLLQEAGAEIKYFSPLTDTQLPEGTSGILLYGGYPELFGKELEANEKIRTVIGTALAAGMPCLAECGGFMYLHEQMTVKDGSCYQMVGAVSGSSYPTETLQRFGYISLTTEQNGILGSGRSGLKGHEFHYFESSSPGAAYTARKPLRKRSWQCLHGAPNLLAGFPHLYYYSCPELAVDFLAACRQYDQMDKRRQR